VSLSSYPNVRVKPMPMTGTVHAWSRAGSLQQLPTTDTPA
jgi:hypothetical protein